MQRTLLAQALRGSLALGLACAGLLAAFSSPAAPAAAKPNILVILADDIGWSDLGCYGSEIATPNLDALARNGLRFTQFYNTARCCPTRASLLTGLHPHQAGVGHMTDTKPVSDGYAGNLNDRCVTLPEALKPAGYRSFMAGKWHVARRIAPGGPMDTWPMQRGFDQFYGTLAGAGSYFDPGTLCRGNTFITPLNDPLYNPAAFYYTDAIADNAAAFIREHLRQRPGQPFFGYVAFTAAHWPLHAPAEDVAAQKGRYDAGYEPVRAARFARQKQTGLIDPNWPLSPLAGRWNTLSNTAWEARCMEVYAAQVHRMDLGVGRIVEELKRLGQLDNTLILYLQDNGACAENIGRGINSKPAAAAGLAPMGPDTLQTNTRPPMQTRDGRPLRSGPQVMPGPADTYISYGQGWANVSSTPFREYKHWTHEGGIGTPLIVHWPAGIPPARRNALVPQPGQLPDIMATCLEAAGAQYPAQFNGRKITPLQGTSLLPAFAGKPVERDGLFWEHEGNRAVRDGQWKLVAKGPGGPWELYDMTADRTEMNDLASRHPERVKTLAAKWQAWAARSSVLPWPWNTSSNRSLSTATRFDLAPGASLPGAEAPNYINRPFTVTARIATPGRQGVLAAQGGRAHGWALFFQEGALRFAINRSGSLEDFTSGDPAFATAKTITATLDATAALSLAADGRVILSSPTAGFPSVYPVDGLQVGRDVGGAVGPYATPFAFTGEISGVLIELGPEKAPARD